MNTSNSTLPRPSEQVDEHPHWCDLHRCALDPAGGTRVHISAASDRCFDAPGGYDLTTRLLAVTGSTEVVAAVDLTTDLLDVNGLRHLIDELTALRRELVTASAQEVR